MNYNPILVRHIQHLTDARYFAAMGVDYMSLVLDRTQDSFDRWHAILDWVEGSEKLAELSDNEESLLARIIIDAKPNGIVFQSGMIPNLPESVDLFITKNLPPFIPDRQEAYFIFEIPASSIEAGILQQLSADNLFIQTDWTPASIGYAVRSGYTGGFCFSGGKEESTGVRDYSQMDDMINLLR